MKLNGRDKDQRWNAMGVTADEEDDRRTCMEEGDDETADECWTVDEDSSNAHGSDGVGRSDPSSWWSMVVTGGDGDGSEQGR